MRGAPPGRKLADASAVMDGQVHEVMRGVEHSSADPFRLLGIELLQSALLGLQRVGVGRPSHSGAHYHRKTRCLQVTVKSTTTKLLVMEGENNGGRNALALRDPHLVRIFSGVGGVGVFVAEVFSGIGVSRFERAPKSIRRRRVWHELRDSPAIIYSAKNTITSSSDVGQTFTFLTVGGSQKPATV